MTERVLRLMPLLYLLLGLACVFGAAPAAAQETPAQTYIEIPPMQAPIMQAGRIHSQIRLQLQIEARPGADEQRTRDMLPRLQTALQGALLDIARSRLRPRKAPDVAFIVDRMQAVTDRILGPDIARLRVDNVSILR